MENKKILISLGGFGPFIEEGDIDNILNPKLNEFYYWRDIKKRFGWFFKLPVTCLTREILTRYVEITRKADYNNFTIREDKLYDKIVAPLESAKLSYSLGNYLSAIATAGLSCESLTLYIWVAGNINIGKNKLSRKDEEILFGKAFDDKLSQERRLNILKLFGLVEEDDYKKFNSIRDKRNKYLHIWKSSVEEKDYLSDAKEILVDSFYLYNKYLGPKLANAGSLSIPKELDQYLVKNKKLS